MASSRASVAPAAKVFTLECAASPSCTTSPPFDVHSGRRLRHNSSQWMTEPLGALRINALAAGCQSGTRRSTLTTSSGSTSGSHDSVGLAVPSCKKSSRGVSLKAASSGDMKMPMCMLFPSQYAFAESPLPHCSSIASSTQVNASGYAQR